MAALRKVRDININAVNVKLVNAPNEWVCNVGLGTDGFTVYGFVWGKMFTKQPI